MTGLSGIRDFAGSFTTVFGAVVEIATLGIS